MRKRSIWIGYEPRELDAYVVAVHSLRKHLSVNIPIHGVILRDLERSELYVRKYHVTAGRMVDHISQAPMSTEFAISRFLVPSLAGGGLALYLDCDVLIRADLNELFEIGETVSYAVWCVKHEHKVVEGKRKMDDKVQVNYPRKNWSSIMMFDCNHPSNRKLTVDQVNSLPGRDLHRFCWLEDREIGSLGPEWNYLVGYTKPKIDDPKIVHFTNGTPSMYGFGNSEFADEWRETLLDWLR